MAKIVNCSICGKEMTKRFLGSDVKRLNVGDQEIDCCPECYAKYVAAMEQHAKRFGAKLRNYKLATRQKKLPDAQIGHMYAVYRQEADCFCHVSQPRTICNLSGGIFISNERSFSATEFSNDYFHKDLSVYDMASWVGKKKIEDGLWFTKDDISKIEFARNGRGMFNGLFDMLFSYTIRLNDESIIGYRPAVSRMVVKVKFPYFARRRAEKKIIAHLELFKQTIGSELPIVRTQR